MALVRDDNTSTTNSMALRVFQRNLRVSWKLRQNTVSVSTSAVLDEKIRHKKWRSPSENEQFIPPRNISTILMGTAALGAGLIFGSLNTAEAKTLPSDSSKLFFKISLIPLIFEYYHPSGW